jgi:hypothetical protein
MPTPVSCSSSINGTVLCDVENPCCCDLVKDWIKGWEPDPLSLGPWDSPQEQMDQRYAMAKMYCELDGES